MRILFAGGGTGGHLYPALAVAKELRRTRPADEILFVGTRRGIEARAVPGAGFKLRTLHAAGLKGLGLWRKLVNLAVLPWTFLEAAAVLARFRPQVVVGTGGYSSGPVVLEAAWARIPTLLMEPNSVPGFTNRVLARWVRRAAVGFDVAAEYFGGKAVVTGIPVREEFFQIEPRPNQQREREATRGILIFGGSQGAGAVNRALIEALPEISRETESYHQIEFYHQTGETDYNVVRAAYAQQGISATVVPYVDRMAEIFAKVDLVIARSGALTVAELAASGRASLLVPFPAAADDHQTQNAKTLERAGAARVLPQRELTPERLAKEINELLGDPAQLHRMGTAARRLARPDAVAQVVKLISDLSS